MYSLPGLWFPKQMDPINETASVPPPSFPPLLECVKDFYLVVGRAKVECGGPDPRSHPAHSMGVQQRQDSSEVGNVDSVTDGAGSSTSLPWDLRVVINLLKRIVSSS